MNLSVISTTLREIARDSSQFPDKLRSLICDVVSAISLADMEAMRDKHESNSENFDGRIEKNIRAANWEIILKANCRISDITRFDNDLIIEENNNLVCMEIEKGEKARFEFDILKMQAFASHRKHKQPEANIFGAFLVPTDNRVDRNISGNPRESSYKYLRRLFKLVAQIKPLLLDDILLIGYGTSIPSLQSNNKMPARTPKHSTNQRPFANKDIQRRISLLARELDPNILEQLCYKAKSKAIFDINYPVFIKIRNTASGSDKKGAVKDNGINRWTWEFEFEKNGFLYAISTQWYPRSDMYVEQWLHKYEA